MAGAFEWSLLKIPHDESDSNMSSAQSLSTASHDGLTDGEWAQAAEVASAVEEANAATSQRHWRDSSKAPASRKDAKQSKNRK